MKIIFPTGNLRKRFALLHFALLPLVVLCFLYSLAYAGNIEKESPRIQKGLYLLSTFEGGKLYSVGQFRVLELSGTYRQMGRQYGRLMTTPMKEMYSEIISQYAKNGIACADINLEDFSKQLFGLYPGRFRELAYGMSETSGLDLNKIAVLNEFFDYILKSHVPMGSENNGNCSAITVWDKYTKDKTLVMGRNFDFPAFYRAFNKFITIVAYNPSDSVNSTAVITYAGQISSIQVFNSSGLVIENNDGSSSDDRLRHFGKRIPFAVKDLSIMQENSTYEALDAALLTLRMHYPLIYNVAYPGGAFTYEMTTFDVKRRQGQNGLLVATNHFISPGWNPPSSQYKDGIANSKKRYDNLFALGEKYKGQIDVSTMMMILDLPDDQGGATPQDRCIYQFIAQPANLKIWIKAPTYSDWTEVDLKALFHK